VGTVGAKLLAGQRNKAQRIEVDKKTFLDVKCNVEYLSFSAHADAAGIEELIRMCEPKNVMLVHGEKNRILEFKAKVVRDFGIPCFDPPNGTTISIHTPTLELGLCVSSQLQKDKRPRIEQPNARLQVYTPPPVASVLVLRADEANAHLLGPAEAASATGVVAHDLSFVHTVKSATAAAVFERIKELLRGEPIVMVGAKEVHYRTLVAKLHDGAELKLTWNILDNVLVTEQILSHIH
jgi:integrator complex subunit 11